MSDACYDLVFVYLYSNCYGYRVNIVKFSVILWLAMIASFIFRNDEKKKKLCHGT